MAAKYWLKLYHEILDDPKLAKQPDRLWRRIIECFLLAGDNNKKGELPKLSDMAWRLRMKDDELEKDLQALSKLSVVKKIKDKWIVRKFEERQRARTPAERTKAHRDQKDKNYTSGWFDDD